MVAVAQTNYVPLQNYFAGENEAETKSEYYDGVVVAMAGASLPHVLITSNLQGELYARLKGSPCQSFMTDMRVYAAVCNAVFYPDAVVACEPPDLAQTRAATLLNPTLIVEVLSPSTESVDRGAKYACYTSLSSLAAYVLVAQEQPRVEVFARQEDGSWQRRMVEGLDASLSLPAIGCELRLADLYARVTFPPAEENDAEDL